MYCSKDAMFFLDLFLQGFMPFAMLRCVVLSVVPDVSEDHIFIFSVNHSEKNCMTFKTSESTHSKTHRHIPERLLWQKLSYIYIYVTPLKLIRNDTLKQATVALQFHDI